MQDADKAVSEIIERSGNRQVSFEVVDSVTTFDGGDG